VTRLTGKKIQAIFYRSSSGNEPVRDWLLSLSQADRRAIGADIQTLELGWPIGMPVCRSMKDGLYEVRTSLKSHRVSRVLFCFVDGQMVLLHGFIKKSKKTPNTELALARTRRREVDNG